MNANLESESSFPRVVPNSSTSTPHLQVITQRSMSAGQYYTFLTTSVLVSLLFIIQVFLGRFVQYNNQQLSELEQEIQRGEQSYTRWQQLAARTYQLSQNDAGLHDVVVRQIPTKTPATTTPAASAPVAPAVPAVPAITH